MSEKKVASRTQHLLNKALDDSNVPWWEWDITENRVICNDLKASMLGYSPKDFINSGYQGFTELLHPDDYQRTMQAMVEHLEGRAPLYQIDYRIRKADGTYTWYMDRGAIIEWDEQGNPLRLRGVVINLGEAFEALVSRETMIERIRESFPVPGDENPIQLCSSCKKIQVAPKIWLEVDASFETYFFGELSHGICPECFIRLYPDFEDLLVEEV